MDLDALGAGRLEAELLKETERELAYLEEQLAHVEFGGEWLGYSTARSKRRPTA